MYKEEDTDQQRKTYIRISQGFLQTGHVQKKSKNIIVLMNQREPLTEKLLESVESSKFVSCKAILSGEFYSKKDSKTTEFERRPQILVKLNFGEFGNSNLSSFCTFDNIAIS